MTSETMQYLIFAGLIALLSKGFIEWIKERKNGNPGRNNYRVLNTIKEQVAWLKEIHNQRDNSGAPLWYVPRDWKEGIDTLEKRSIETNVLLKEILREIQEQKHV